MDADDAERGAGPPRGGMALLRANTPFRRLVAARAVSFVGDSLSLVALILYTASEVGEAYAVAALLLVGDCLPSLLAPLAGALADRFERRRMMVACELVQGAAVAAIAGLLPSLGPLLLLVALRALAALAFQAASRAAVPGLVDDADLEGANAALGAGTNGLEVLGPLLAGALLPVLDVRGVLLVDAATFGLSALLLATLPRSAASRRPDGDRPALLGDAWHGLRSTWALPPVRALALAFTAVVALNGVDDVALVFLATDDLDAGAAATGLLYAGAGLGLLAGYALLLRGGRRASVGWLLVAGFAVSSAGNLATGLAWAVGAAFALQAVRGLGLAAMDVASTTLVQRRVPAHLQGRVFGNLYGAVGLAAGLSYVLGAVLLELTSARVTLVVAGGGGLVVALVAAIALPRPLGR